MTTEVMYCGDDHGRACRLPCEACAAACDLMESIESHLQRMAS